MANLIPWRRKREERELAWPELSLARMRRDMDTLFDRFMREPFGLPGFEPGLAGMPRMDLAETDENLTATLELPGIDPKDVEISVASGLLTVRGQKKHVREEKKADYHFCEREFGSFQRTVQLPSTVDPDKVDAAYKDGVLTITIGKHPEAKPRRIKVKNA